MPLLARATAPAGGAAKENVQGAAFQVSYYVRKSSLAP